MSPRTVAAVWLTLATAVRIGECAGARWEHIDFKARTWHLPETKNQREHTVHLSKFALRQLDALHALRPLTPTGAPSPYVFPSAADTANGIDPRTFGKQLTDRQRPTDGGKWAGRVASAALALPGERWTPHDLRRTAATLMAELGVSSDVIDECLNHKIESKVRRIYIRDRRLADQARAFDALGKRLESLIAESVVSNVAPSRKRSRVVAK